MQRGRREGDGVSSRSCADFHNPRSCSDDNVEHMGLVSNDTDSNGYCMESDDNG